MRRPVALAALGLCVAAAVLLFAAAASRAAGPSWVTWDQRIEVAAGNAHRGPWRMNRSNFDYVDDPTVAITDQGVVAVAWVDQARQTVLLQVYRPDGTTRFAAPVDVSRTPGIFSWLPRMVVSGGDAREVYVLWQEIVFSGGSHGGEIFFARSIDGGASFTGPINLSNSLPGDGKGRLTARRWHNGSLDLVQGPEGTLIAAWTEYEGTLWVSRSTDGGASFSKPLPVDPGPDAGPARGPSLAVGAAGTVHLAWTVGEDQAADIRVATSRDQGRTFGPPRIVGQSDGHADAPKLAVDGAGKVHLVYGESPTGPFARYHIRYTSSGNGGRTWAPPRPISGAHWRRFDSVGFPALSLDGAGNLYVLWELFPDRRGYSRGLGITTSRDGGQSFAPPSVIPGTGDRALGNNGGQQGLLMRKLAVNGAGALAVVNSTFKRGETSHIWLIRGQAAGR